MSRTNIPYFIIILIFLHGTSVSAESFMLSGSKQLFELRDGLLIKGCKSKCEALNNIYAHKDIHLSKIRSGMRFSNSIGSDVCARVYHAGSLLGVASNQDRRAFCVFKDQSMVEMNSLTSFLTKKGFVDP